MRTVISPFHRFFRIEATGGILILLFTVLALFLTNSSLSTTYHSFLEKTIAISVDSFHLSDSIIHWINNGLMFIFFFVAGLEIKRELLIGELSSNKKASMPAFAALGGILFPALIYTFFNKVTEYAGGWTIPTATDIALCFGVLSLIGNRVPLSLKVFIFAFAIFDNLSAVTISIVMNHTEINLNYLLIGLGLYLYLVLFNVLKIRVIQIYMIFGLVIWYMFLESGIHPAITGIFIAFAIPKERKIRISVFRKRMEANLLQFLSEERKNKVALSDTQLTAIDNMVAETGRVKSPLQSLEHKFHKFVTYIVLPVFVLANAGVLINISEITTSLHPLAKLIGFSLIFGKVLGVFTFSWVAVKLKLAYMPGDIKWMHIFGVAMLGGIGFTMSLFISNITFVNHELLDSIKKGIYLGSLISALLAFIILRLSLKKQKNK